FDPAAVARFDASTVQKLLQNSGLIRNRKKIEAAVVNARQFLTVQHEFGSFDAYIWRFVNGRPIVNFIRSDADYPATSPESEALSRDMRRRGFVFVGPTICYAHMQATGMVNDHTLDCFRRQEIIDGNR
ncbi:MAG TPA: DNA-3-methyladenine glycosylase I, partial [Desulfatirhabdiaceae bacterium]|nr:DNA-3-methyladenine glycosylase I [Desulfatirhabdiaceae bacterium]